MTDTVTISVKSYNDMMDTMRQMKDHIIRLKFELAIYKSRVMKKHQEVSNEYEAYFNKKDDVVLDRTSMSMDIRDLD